MENLKIKITGGGTRDDVAKALLTIARQILDTPIEDLDGCEWEDCTLMTEVNSDDLVECDGCGEVIPETDLYCRNCGDENF
jgi:hypothetical protein